MESKMFYPPPQEGKWFIYAMECEDGSVYIGQTVNLANRWKQHSSGRGARWTRLHKPVQIFYYEEALSYKEAWHRERDLKKHHRRWLKGVLKRQKESEKKKTAAGKTKPVKPRKKPKRVLRRKKKPAGKDVSRAANAVRQVRADMQCFN